jgi:HEAT repeat protein
VLGNVGAVDAAVVPALIAAAKDRDARVRRAAIVALLRIGPKASQAVVVLEEAAQDEDAKVREYAAKALKAVRGG